MEGLAQLLALLRSLAASRNQLALENAALRHQVAVLKRSVKRARVEDSDRVFWILMRRFLKDWKGVLVFVQPDTVVRWHRTGWRYYWRRKSKPRKVGRPPISFKLIHLIRKMSKENPLWGAPHIHDELALLGHDVAESTIAKYMVRHPDPERRQSWRTFLQNHLRVSAACDFFTVPTLTFKTLYCFVVLAHDRRRILHVAVTQHPTEAWTIRQLVEAFPGDGLEPRFLLRDRDAIYGSAFRDQLKAMGIKDVASAPKSPWQNPFVERVIGSIRRECTDHVIVLGERHLRRVLTSYFGYHHRSRTHLSLEKDPPETRNVEQPENGEIRAVPQIGGLHRRYTRMAA